MANDVKDIMLAILKYLEDSMDDERVDFSKVNANSLDISEQKHSRVLSIMLGDGYIKGFVKVPRVGVAYDGYKAMDPRITSAGMDYLYNNKMSKKTYALLKEIKEWIPGI